MPEEILIELSQQPPKKPFYKTVGGIAIISGIIFIIFAAIFSWWLAKGKIVSSAARLDTMIYTVGSDFPAKIKSILVATGDLVAANQPLGLIESPEFAGQLESAARELANLRAMAGLPQSRNSADSANQIEKEAASKLAQARYEEDRLQKIYQNAVEEHVRAQLALRSLSVSNTPSYTEALNKEQSLRASMQQSLENFEKASKFRAKLDQALAKIKNAILSAKRKAHMNLDLPDNPAEASATFAGETTLFSPAQGSVFRITAQPGQIVQPGESIFYILPLNDSRAGERWIQAWFSSKHKEEIKAGQPVSIKFPAMDLVLSGKVENVSMKEQTLPENLGDKASIKQPSESASQKLYIPVKISLNDASRVEALEPGAAAECQIQTHYIIGNGWL